MPVFHDELADCLRWQSRDLQDSERKPACLLARNFGESKYVYRHISLTAPSLGNWPEIPQGKASDVDMPVYLFPTSRAVRIKVVMHLGGAIGGSARIKMGDLGWVGDAKTPVGHRSASFGLFSVLRHIAADEVVIPSPSD